MSCFKRDVHLILLMEEILHQLRLAVFPIIYKGLYIPCGDRRISEPSTVFWSNISEEVEVPSKPTPSELTQRHIQDSVVHRSHLS